MTDTPATEHRAGLAIAHRLYLQYHAEGSTAFAEDLARVTALYERACDEIDRLRAQALPC
ncbi:hypothetical protein [Azospirillum sp. SYSU D00513]|uniref:hypothetical protein n=1 Tax=Azospirillum sp. SYSU D00513 TaxID=2812561 RepID=UPI001A9771D9|nr:hypothetical protein [Azospirillum sp. SYSU D00513]